ncbi:MAG: DNA primase [Clostridiales bacterium]|jgi:DNA primase|nr:DNA primase [Clostridiales bacterium]
MGKTFSPELIEEIKDRNNIGEVISAYTHLEKKGTSLKGLCPFHREKTPSFSVLESKQMFHCFGCGKGGNVVNFIMLAEHLEYYDALAFLADRAGIEVPEYDPGGEDKAKLRQDMLAANKIAARYYFQELKASPEAINYLVKRGIAPNIVKKFGLGYAPERNGLHEHLKSSGVSEAVAVASGLTQKGKDGNTYDRFRNRIIFPIFDIVGNVIAFGGRVMDNTLPKYINSPETQIYTKGKHLYGLNFARKSGSKRVIIVEGYMDCIALNQKGIEWTVASLGTSMTENQGKLLKKYFDEVIICYDADAAGQNATIRGLDILARLGCRVKVLRIPETKDPDEYMRSHSVEEFIDLIAVSKNLVQYKVELLANDKDLDDLDTKTQFLKGLAKIVGQLEGTLERDVYINEFSREYDISRNVFAGAVDELVNGRKPVPIIIDTKKYQQGRNKNPDTYKKLDKNEKLLILLLCQDITALKKITEENDPDIFSLKCNRETAKLVWEGSINSWESLLDKVGLEEAGEYSGIMVNWLSPENSLEACVELAEKLQEFKYERKRLKILKQLEQRDISEEEKLELREQLNKLLKIREKRQLK